MSFEFFVSHRYIRTRQKQTFISLITWLSIAGVTVGVMALIVVIAVMTGFESDLKSRILGVESHIILTQKEKFSGYREILRDLEKNSGIEGAAPFVETQVMLRSPANLSGTALKGMDPLSADGVIRMEEKKGENRQQADFRVLENSDESQFPGVILGKELAEKLGVRKGNALYLISPRGMITPMGHLPAMRRFEVRGLFESGMYEYDSGLAYIHIREAQKLLHMDDAVSGIEIRVSDIYQAEKLAEKLVNDLSLKYGQSYQAEDWTQMNKSLFSALQLEKTVMFIILALIVLVAAFNIASSLIMMVMEKTKDIAILKTMGAADRSIRKIFILKGLAIGLTGTALGTGLGVLLCALLEHYQFVRLPGDVYYITTLPVLLEFPDVLMIASAAMLICFSATLYPARQASGLDPAEAIRYG